MAEHKCTVIAIMNQKGGVAKTTTTINLAAALHSLDKKVLVIDYDPQASLTRALSGPDPQKYDKSINTLMSNIFNGENIEWEDCAFTHPEGYDFIPSDIKLSNWELQLVVATLRELYLKKIVDCYTPYYDYILIDTLPSLGILCVNAMAAADQIIIPLATEDMALDGLDLLLASVARTRKSINQNLKILGILLTMVDTRNSESKEIIADIRKCYETSNPAHYHIFNTYIPRAVSASRMSRYGASIYTSDPKGKVAAAYRNIAEEVLASNG